MADLPPGKNTNYFRRLIVALAEEFERETGKKQVPGSPEWREWLDKNLFRVDKTPPTEPNPAGPLRAGHNRRN